jgi:predicted ATPase
MTTVLSPHADGTFVGRRTELQQFTAGVAATADGLGSVWFVTGEPGIGTSRLLEEVASIAAHGGLDLHWGRCWEVGGAPAYWPWVQILRSLFRGPDAKDVLSSIGTGAAHLSQLIPESVGDVRPPTTPLRLEPEQARFQLMDGIATVLRVFSERTPVVLTLEDLHAADPASILLLDFLQGQIRSMRVMVIGTYRVSEAHLRDTETLLFKVAREARVLRLQRLTFEDTAEYLKRVIGRPMPPKTIDAIASAAEGNPLYLGEIVSLLRARGELDRVGNGTVSITVPETIKAAIRERAGALSAGARHVLETASILGREFNSSDLAQLTGLEATAIEDALSEATRAAVVDHAGAGCSEALRSVAPAGTGTAHGRIGRSRTRKLPCGGRAGPQPRRNRAHGAGGPHVRQRVPVRPGRSNARGAPRRSPRGPR